MFDFHKELLRIVDILNTRNYKIGDVVKATGLRYHTLQQVRTFKEAGEYYPKIQTIKALSDYFSKG